MAQIAGYAFNEGSGTTAAEINGGTSVTGVPGWAAGRHGNAMAAVLTDGPVVDPYASNTNFTIMFDLYLLGSGGSGYNLILDGGSGLFGTLQTGSSGAGDLEWYHDADSLGPIATGLALTTWYNICISADGSTRKIYVDGTMVGSRSTVRRDADNPIQLGGLQGGGFTPNFRMDNLRFFDTALNDATVASLAGTAVTAGGASNTINLADSLGLTDLASIDGVDVVNLADSLVILDPGNPQQLEFTETIADAIGGTDVVTPNTSSSNIQPVALAGPDQTVVPGQVVTLDGSASIDQGGLVETYTWVQISGPTVTLAGAGATRTFTAPSAGTYVFGLTVTDNNGAPSAQDTVTITASSVQDLLVAAGYVPYIIVPL